MTKIKKNELLDGFGIGDKIVSSNYIMTVASLDLNDKDQPVRFDVYTKDPLKRIDCAWPFKGISAIPDGKMSREANEEDILFIIVNGEEYVRDVLSGSYLKRTTVNDSVQDKPILAEVFQFEDGGFLAGLWDSEYENDLGYKSTVIIADVLFKAKLFDTGSSEEKDFIVHTYNGFFRTITIK